VILKDIITLVSNKIFVGSLPFEFTDEQLRALFTAIGPVASAKMVDDKKNGRTRGFGFVAMSHDSDIQSAIEKLNGTAVGEKKIWVTEARPKVSQTLNALRVNPEDRPQPRGFGAPRRARPPRKGFRGPRTGERGPRAGFGSSSRGGDRPHRSGFGAPRGRGRPGGFGGSGRSRGGPRGHTPKR